MNNIASVKNSNSGNTISMNNGVITLPSAALMAQRLENFEIALRDQTIAELGQTIAEHEQNFDDMIAVTASQIKEVRALKAANQLLAFAKQNQSDFISELELAGNQLCDEREQLRAEVERLIVQSVAADRVLKKALEQQKDGEAELKKLRALDPEKLKSRLDRLKRDSNTRKQAIRDLRISNRQFSEKNRGLSIEVSKLNATLDKAIEDINNGNIMEPIRTITPPRLGSWEIFGTNVVGTYCVLDVERQTNQQITVLDDGGTDIPKIRPIPKAVQTAAEQLHKELLLNSLPATRQGE